MMQEINFFEAFDFKDDGPEEEDDEVQVDDGNSEDAGSAQGDIPELEDGEDEEDDRIMNERTNQKKFS